MIDENHITLSKNAFFAWTTVPFIVAFFFGYLTAIQNRST